MNGLGLCVAALLASAVHCGMAKTGDTPMQPYAYPCDMTPDQHATINKDALESLREGE